MESYGGFVRRVSGRRSFGAEDREGAEGWSYCFRGADGWIYLHGDRKCSPDGSAVLAHAGPSLAPITRRPEGATLVRDGLFYAAAGDPRYLSPGRYAATAWRSSDDLETIEKETVELEVPDGARPTHDHAWHGVYFSSSRRILTMPDGTWLTAMTANFEDDTLPPADRQSALESKYQNRSIVVSSTDDGRSWRYLSTVAAPVAGDPVGEGFDEPTIERLADGRILCVMRTGHFSPLHACWSADGGSTWSTPVYTGFDRGCCPKLTRLSDGRILLHYGVRWPPGSRIDQRGPRWQDHSLLKLAISDAGGDDWDAWRVATLPAGLGSTYATIIEVERDLLFCQVDGWFLHVAIGGFLYPKSSDPDTIDCRVPGTDSGGSEPDDRHDGP